MEVQKLDTLIDESENKAWKNLFIEGNSYKNYATLIIIATRGKKEVTKKCECGKDVCIEYQVGFHPWIVESWKRLIKPMNVPVTELVVSGHEVGEAYEEAIKQVLTNPNLVQFKYLLFMEDDVIIPFIPGTYGPLIEMYKHLESGYDIASGLYWTKGDPSLPLIYGDGDINSSKPFEVNINWRPGDVVNVNGSGMGFTLMKRSIFESGKISSPFFKSVNEMTEAGPIGFTQDLFFYKKAKEAGFKICVDTNIRCGHLDITTEKIY